MSVLTAHYGSPGQLADYRLQFERTVRMSREDPSIFATALEMFKKRYRYTYIYTHTYTHPYTYAWLHEH